MNVQTILSAQVLVHVRQLELAAGVASIAHLTRHPAALRATPARRHKITDRAARKAVARQRVLAGWVGEARKNHHWPSAFRKAHDRCWYV